MNDFKAAREAMVDCQVRPSDVTRYAIIDAMLAIPREKFVPKARREVAYADCEIALGGGRTMLAPRTFAKMLEAASIRKDDLVLELAPGSGYSTAILARMAQAVVAIEPVDTLRESAVATLEALEVDNAVVSDGDLTVGDPEHGPYDVIFINGAVEDLPTTLFDQLKSGGRLVVIGRNAGVSQCRVIVRSGEAVSDRYAFDASAPVLANFEKKPEFQF